MKALLTALIAVFLFVQSGAAIYTSPPSIDKAIRSLVRVEFEAQPKGVHVCTGFVVSSSKGWAITARHCVIDKTPVYVDGQESEIVKQNGLFTIVRIPPMSKPTLELRDRELPIGERLYAIGYGFGQLMVFNRGFSGWIDKDIMLDGPLVGGMSGGPIIDQDGRVVGLNQASSEYIGLGCSYKELKEFIGKK